MGAFSAGAGPSTQSAGDHPPRKLLIVEDDEDFADSLISILKPYGLELRVAREPLQVAEMLEHFPAEVALIDIRLGRFSGLDVVAYLKTRNPAILTVIMTAYVAAETAIEALRRGAYDYLTKPFQPSELQATLERCFDRIDLERARASAEAARRKSQARLRALVGNSLDLVAVIDPLSRSVRFVTPSVTGLLGYTLDSGIPRDFFEYVHPEERADARDVLQFCAQNEGAMRTVELRFLHLNGSWRWFEVAARGLLREPAIAGVLICARDVTDRRAMEEKLRQVQRMEAVGQLTGGVAHDFNNLLAVIIGNLDLLKRELDGDNPEQLQLIEGGMHAAQRGATLIRRLLAFARRQTLSPRAIDLNELIENAIELLRRGAGPRIQIETNLAPDLAPCTADTAELETALLNLVINARDAMPDGGRIEIATSNVRLRGDEEVTEGTGEPYVRVAVTDSGSGIAANISHQIFEPFFSTKPPSQGTGLGLSMVFGFVEQSNGKIRWASEVGVGTTFFLYFPRSVETVSQARQRTPVEAPGSRNETILLVEDDAEVRQVLHRLLGELGYRVTAAASGAEALALLEGGLRPDLLLTDVVLAEGPSGFELAEQARARQPELKLLFTSGYAQGLASRRPTAVAGTFLLQKPFHRTELAHLVRRALDTPPSET
jgi:PAS domain S-box-containing protein